MSLVDALATSASHAAEAQSLGHILQACHNGRTGSYELSNASGWASITHEFATLDALVEYLETANRLETDATSGSGWRPLWLSLLRPCCGSAHVARSAGRISLPATVSDTRPWQPLRSLLAALTCRRANCW